MICGSRRLLYRFLCIRGASVSAGLPPLAHPLELTFEEGVDFLRQINDFGDPLKRPVLYQLIDTARVLGIGISRPPLRPRLREMNSLSASMALPANGMIQFAAFPARSISR